jgi:hypothetical protein
MFPLIFDHMANLPHSDLAKVYENACLIHNKGELARGQKPSQFPSAKNLRVFQFTGQFRKRPLKKVYINVRTGRHSLLLERRDNDCFTLANCSIT